MPVGFSVVLFSYGSFTSGVLSEPLVSVVNTSWPNT